jgi:hypothetical protein
LPKKRDPEPEKGKPISLDPVPFEEAVADLLKVKPKKTTKRKSKPRQKRSG